MFKSRTAFEVKKGIKAFLHLDAGLVRGDVPHPEQEAEQAQQRLERTRKQLAARERQLESAQKRLAARDRQLEQLRASLSHKGRRSDVLRAAPPGTGSDDHRGDPLRAEVAAVLDRIPVDFGGGCSLGKAYVMASLIREYDLKTTVDIGVYRGRSLFPQALAHQRFTGGVVYGVDPWSASEAREKDNADLKEKIDLFADETDFQAIYEEVESLRSGLGYEDYCVLLRRTSAEAAASFLEEGTVFDMVHIDGNHDTARVLEDVDLYLPRIKENGYVVVDDVSWGSVRPAYEKLSAQLPLLFERVRPPDDYAVFWNRSSPSSVDERRRFLERVAGN